MGLYQFRLPDIGEGVVEGEIVVWHVEVGSKVIEDDPILEVMTDKATVEIPSPVDGTVLSATGAVGEVIPVGKVFIEFEVEGGGNADYEEADTSESETASVASDPEPTYQTAELEDSGQTEALPQSVQTPPSTHTGGRAIASPAVRHRARESGIDLATIAGSGPAGRVTHADLDARLAGASVSGAMQPLPSKPAGVKRTGASEHPVMGLRRKIAEKMVISSSNIPHFSYFEEVDVTELEALRKALNDSRAPEQPKLTYLPFIMLAIARAMPSHPECNAIHDEDANTVIRHEAVNLGIATSTERGLYVPVVKHVEEMDVWTAAAQLGRLSGAARDGTIAVDELGGSTFTITSLGRDGGIGATPIINHPEVGILGVHKALERPMVVEGRIEVRRMMNLSSSFDHRVVDGSDGAALVQTIKRMLEHPALIFM